jgi:hypothetical protein
MVKVVSPLSQREVEGTQVDFESTAEPWASYKLSDGSVLKVRTILTAILRLEGEYDAAGNPIYTVSSQTVVQVNAPKNLRGTPSIPGGPGMPTAPRRGGPEVR